MRYVSTRGRADPVGFSAAVAAGLAPDGGLYVPESLPALGGRLNEWSGLGYAELAFNFLRLFATDLPEPELRAMLVDAYAGFPAADAAPLRRLGPNLQVLELFHGPTLAFKDFALQWLGRLYVRQCRERGERLNVLGATSGDTGAAAIHGLLGRPEVAIFILYPDGRIAPLQERQMACTGDPRVYALAVEGTFDDAQRVLKEIFGDAEFRTHRRLAAVNSINLARILAQCVYYLHAWLRLPADQRDAEWVVPTGNFGNVLAGWMLRRMGVPLRGFRVATNQNDILHRLFATGEYRLEAVRPSLAPSMDIQVASNFERFLYYALGGEAGRVEAVLARFAADGQCRLPDLPREGFTSSRCGDAEIPGLIASVYREHGYIVDPHTSCGFAGLDPARPAVVLATASPAKFPATIRAAIGVEPTDPALERLKGRPVIRHPIKADAGAIRDFILSHGV
jgi:threonine synthase